MKQQTNTPLIAGRSRRRLESSLPASFGNSLPLGLLIATAGLIGMVGCAANPGSGDPAQPAGVQKYADGVRAYKAGEREEAVSDLQSALHENPNLRMAHVLLGELYRVNGDYSHAAEQYELAARLDPYSWSNHYNLGVSYQFLHRLEDSAAAYLKALNLKPTDLRTNMNLGLVYMALGHMNESRTYLKKATQIEPKSSQAWSNYGVSLDASGDFSDAESAYRTALELDPSSISALENLAANLIAQRKAQESVAVCQQLLLRLDTPLTRKRYADALALAGDKDGAAQQYDTALKRDPKYYPAMSDKGFLLIEQYKTSMELDEPKRTAAMGLWEQSLKLNPDQPRVSEALTQWRTGQSFGK